MLFNSYPFLLLFLPVTLAVFFLLGSRSPRFAAAWLALASLAFYGWWDPRYLPLLLGSAIANFLGGKLLWNLRAAGKLPATRVALVGAVSANLCLLAYFKYTNFFLASLAPLGLHAEPLDIILPLGISFFTFTQIAFLVDTSRGQVKEFNFIHYLLFVTYFPHLIAGPILHHSEMMPQFALPSTYRVSAENVAIGFSYLAIGLCKKCLLADGFSADAGAVFSEAARGASLDAFAAWKGALAYTFQLYFDFSGYCDMAIGLSLMFGIRLPLNFDSPYRAASIIDFWRRWHMTLSRFLRDYLYIPLGGNRHGPFRRYFNLLATMVLGGLWHGASWTFVAWGALHGIFLAINHCWQLAKPSPVPALFAGAGSRILSTVLTFLAVVVAWVFFRASDFATALRILQSMVGLGGGAAAAVPPAGAFELFAAAFGATPRALAWGAMLQYAGAALIIFVLPNTQQIVELGRYPRPGAAPLGTIPLVWRPGVAWGAVLGLLTAMAMLTFTRVSEFLYFQF